MTARIPAMLSHRAMSADKGTRNKRNSKGLSRGPYRITTCDPGAVFHPLTIHVRAQHHLAAGDAPLLAHPPARLVAAVLVSRHLLIAQPAPSARLARNH